MGERKAYGPCKMVAQSSAYNRGFSVLLPYRIELQKQDIWEANDTGA